MKIHYFLFLAFLVCGLSSCFQEEDFAPFYHVTPNDLSASINSSKALFLKQKTLNEILDKKTADIGEYKVIAAEFEKNKILYFVSKDFMLQTYFIEKPFDFRIRIEGEERIYIFESNGVFNKSMHRDSLHMNGCEFAIKNGIFSKNVEHILFEDFHDMDAAYLSKIKNILKNKISNYESNIPFI